MKLKKFRVDFEINGHAYRELNRRAEAQAEIATKLTLVEEPSLSPESVSEALGRWSRKRDWK